MKNVILSFLCVLGFASSALAQEFNYNYGLKAGANYTMGGYLLNTTTGGEAQTFDAQSKIGFHAGAFIEARFGKLFIRPEIIYTSISTEYELPLQTTTHSIRKINMPFLIGYNVFGPLDLFAGPVYSNIIETEVEGDTAGNVVVQDSPINLHAGVKFNLGRWGIGLRYEHILTAAKEIETIQTFDPEVYGVSDTTFEDARVNQVILSLTYKIGGSDVGDGRRRGGCY